MKLSKFSWLKSFVALNVILVFLMPLDFLIDANYMYLKEPPAVNHPLVSGDWPYYLVNLEFVVLKKAKRFVSGISMPSLNRLHVKIY